jgi:DNA polymerase-1
MLEYITTDNKIDDALEKMLQREIATDTETNDLDPLKNHSFLRLIQMKSHDYTCVLDLKYLNNYSRLKIKNLFESPDKVFIFQNAKFDVKWIKAHLGVEFFHSLFCTMEASKLVDGGRHKRGHDLQSQVNFHFGEFLDKEVRTSNWMLNVLSDKQIEYAAKDTFYLHGLRDVHIQGMKKYGLQKVFKLEFDSIEPTAVQELNGISFNYKKWCRVAERQKLRMIRMEYKISDAIIPPEFNGMLFPGMVSTMLMNVTKSSTRIGSRTKSKLGGKFNMIKVREELRNQGVDIPIKENPKGDWVETMGTPALEQIADQHPAIPLLIRRATYKKASESYGPAWSRFIHPVTHRIHPTCNKIGAETGREAYSNPNLQQIPALNMYRTCFIAASGKKLVWGDYSQFELRLLAQFSQDVNMMKAFREGKDLHTYTASLVFKIAYEHVQALHRRRAKDLNFGIVYDIGAKRFAKSAGIPEEEAQRLMNDLFDVYPEMRDWREWARGEAINNRISRTITGRMMLHEFDERNYQEVSLAGRNGINMPIQGSNADVIKIAKTLAYRRHGDWLKLLITVHDEALFECDEEREEEGIIAAKTCLEDAAFQAGMVDVPVKVDMKSGNEWRK